MYRVHGGYCFIQSRDSSRHTGSSFNYFRGRPRPESTMDPKHHAFLCIYYQLPYLVLNMPWSENDIELWQRCHGNAEGCGGHDPRGACPRKRYTVVGCIQRRKGDHVTGFHRKRRGADFKNLVVGTCLTERIHCDRWKKNRVRPCRAGVFMPLVDRLLIGRDIAPTIRRWRMGNLDATCRGGLKVRRSTIL